MLYFDGSCEPTNPGGLATYGWVVLADGEEVQTGSGVAVPPSAESTNNVAEWCALGFALRCLADRGWRGELLICGDSQLVCNQLTGRWACNVGRLQRLRSRCLDLLAKLGGRYSVEWIPREKNERADALSQRAYVEATGKPYPQRRKRPRKG